MRVEPPSAQERTYRPGNFLRVTVPGQLAADRAARCVTYAPEGGFYSDGNGRTAFTHGVQVGVAQGGTGNLQRDTDALLQGFARSNPNLRSAGSAPRDAGRPHRADHGPDQHVRRDRASRKAIAVSTTHLRDGNVLFLVGVSPRDRERRVRGRRSGASGGAADHGLAGQPRRV